VRNAPGMGDKPPPPVGRRLVRDLQKLPPIGPAGEPVLYSADASEGARTAPGVTQPDLDTDVARPSDATDIDVERFVAAVSHDLESSLLVLTNNLELLRAEGPLSPGQADLMQRIERTTQRMKRLLSGVRNFAWARGELELEQVSLRQVLDDCLETLAPAIEEHSAEIVVETDLPTVTGDFDQLVALFQNLLMNAIKFGPRRGRSTVSAEREDGAWRIAIADEGPGIAPENRDRVFEPFRRLRETGNVPGSGLGLTICMRVVKNHGGSLTIEQSEAGGAKFVVRLPDRGVARSS
jgi:signal transduction histidine kinase